MAGPTPIRLPGSRLGLLQICAAGVLWGTGGLAVTFLHQRDGLSAMTVSAWRMLLAAVALIAFAALTRRVSAVAGLLRRHPGRTVLVGVGTATYQGLYFASVLLAGVSVATVVSLGLAPILAAGWEHLRAGTRPSRRQAVVLMAALTGLVLISATAGSNGPGRSPYAGLVLAVAAGAVYAATTVLGHSLAPRTDPTTLTTCTTTAGAIALGPFLIVADPLIGTGAASLAVLAYLGIATMALAYGLLYAGLRTTTGSAATMATLLEPLAAAVLAAILLGERLTWPAVLGGVMILAAVAALRPAGELS